MIVYLKLSMKYLFKLYSLFCLLAVGLGMASCTDDVLDKPASEPSPIEVGEPLQFTLCLPSGATTRAAKDDWQIELDTYHTLSADYSPITVKMMREDVDDISFSGTYSPVKKAGGNYDEKGNLQLIADPLYWQDNVHAWGFEATAGKPEIDTDQSDDTKFFAQDYIKGYGYLPLWREADAEAGTEAGPAYKLEDINYRTAKQWYADHKTLLGQEMVEVSEYKKIPLYMRHQHAWITVRLRAGDGLPRQALKFATHTINIEPSIHSYVGSEDIPVTKPLASEILIDYQQDKNGPAEQNVSSVQFDAIVQPYNYLDNEAKDPIMTIAVSGQKYTFAAQNDERYTDYQSMTTDEARLAHAMQAYNLTGGKHLIIDARLTSTRLVFITAWVVDWVETVTNTICDDYGQNGDPTVISNKAEFLAFLNGPKNKSGNVAIFQATEMDLEEDGDWETKYPLNATLNLAGATIYTKHQIFTELPTSGTIINGIVQMQDGANVDAAIASTNSGTIERIRLTVAPGAMAVATKGGMVDENYGNIVRCSSRLPVQGTSGYVGGIAAQSLTTTVNGQTIIPIIEGCTVNARVDGAAGVQGGGIVGNAAGRVVNNSFEYGITISQDPTRFKNTFCAADHETVAQNNSWPTKSQNAVSADTPNENATPETERYDAVIDSQAELALLLNSQNDQKDKTYRLSADFTVDDTWTYGQKQTLTAAVDGDRILGNVLFDLDGDNHTITLTGSTPITLPAVNGGSPQTLTPAPMLFSNILGNISNLVIYLDKPVVSAPANTNTDAETGTPVDDSYESTDAIAPLGYNLIGDGTGKYGTLTNVYVVAKRPTVVDGVVAADGAYVQSASPAGLVVKASKGAVIEDCHVQTDVRMWLVQETGTQSYHFAGGLVAFASKADIVASQYQGNVTIAGYDPSLVKDEQGKDTHDATKVAPNWYYGGLVGGLVIFKDENNITEIPDLRIFDCSSWFTTTLGTEVNKVNGSIIGLAAYSDASSNKVDGMRAGNQGNWWSGRGVAAAASGVVSSRSADEVALIGRISSVTPTFVAEPDTTE